LLLYDFSGSSHLWAESSDVVHPLPPRLYGRFVPTHSTERNLRETNRKMVDVLDTTRIRRPPPPQTDFSNYINVGNPSSSLSKYSSGGLPSNPADFVAENSNSVVENPLNGSQSPNSYDFMFCCERSWTSHSFLLPPGDYLLLISSEEQKINQPNVVNGIPISQLPPARKVEPRQPTGETPRNLFEDNDEFNQGIWCQISSIGKVGLHSLSLTEIEENADLLGGTFFHQMKQEGLPLPEVWPFMTDHQAEVSSKGLIKLLTDIRNEVNRVNVDFLELKYGDKKKLNKISL
jgi:hypothetical protein